MIFSPSYNGEHLYRNYEELQENLRNAIKNNKEIIVDIDLLYSNEIRHYFKDIFSIVLINCIFWNYDSKILIQSSDKKKLRIIIGILSRAVIVCGPIYQRKQKSIFRAYN